jgi:hypothetical protein
MDECTSDDSTDSATAAVVMGLRRLVLDEIRGGSTREEIVDALHRRGLRLATAWAFLKVLEMERAGLSERLDRHESEALFRRVRSLMSAVRDA